MKTFNICFIETVLSFACVGWFGSLNVQYKNKLQGVINLCSKVAATTFSSILSVYRVRSLKKARSIVADPSHPLSPQFRLLPSGRRFRARRWNYKRLNDSFVNVSLGLLNKWPNSMSYLGLCRLFFCFFVLCAYCNLWFLLLVCLVVLCYVFFPFLYCCWIWIAPRGQ